ncbi:hypothetical protein [Lentisalinibacter salinarum]|uniref:hypothetical protein n=1 Tax=Lentisalinibacter salinarum TaxID=2992239 RepID=UPI003866F375
MLGNLPQGMTGTIDPKRRLFIMIGRGNALFVDIGNKGVLTREELNTSGGDEIVNCAAPGLTYDSANDLIVGWCRNGSVYTLNLDTNRWTEHGTTSSRVPADPYEIYDSPPYWGTYGRFQYVPDHNLFILYYWITENVWVYRLSDEISAPRPEPPDFVTP